jgi:hypothetical protein
MGFIVVAPYSIGGPPVVHDDLRFNAFLSNIAHIRPAGLGRRDVGAWGVTRDSRQRRPSPNAEVAGGVKLRPFSHALGPAVQIIFFGSSARSKPRLPTPYAVIYVA